MVKCWNGVCCVRCGVWSVWLDSSVPLHVNREGGDCVVVSRLVMMSDTALIKSSN